jgi:Sec-independent protein translocase protein TatA
MSGDPEVEFDLRDIYLISTPIQGVPGMLGHLLEFLVSLIKEFKKRFKQKLENFIRTKTNKQTTTNNNNNNKKQTSRAEQAG